MISPERLRRYPFFARLDADQLRELAIITQEVVVAARTVLFEIGEEADHLFLLEQGHVELHHVIVDEHQPALRKDFLVGNVNPGEVLGISSLVKPHVLLATAYAPERCHLLQISARELRALQDRDPRLGCRLLEQIAQAAMQRLHATRVLLAAATTPL